MAKSERKWQKCKTCKHIREVRSHPWVDKKPLSHITGYVCVLPILSENKRVMKTNPNGIQCECWEAK